MARHYSGISTGSVRDPQTRAALEQIDRYLRDVSRGLSPNQPAEAAGSGGIPDASYLTIANEAALSSERRLIVSSPLTGTDAGANTTYTLGLSTSALLALIAGTPTFSYGTTHTAGSASTLIRTDAQHKFPQAVMSTLNSSTLTLTDDGVDQTLTGTLGHLIVQPTSKQMRLIATSGADTGVFVRNTGAAASDTPAFIVSNTVGSATLFATNASHALIPSTCGFFTNLPNGFAITDAFAVQFRFDLANSRLGINRSTPSYPVHVSSASPVTFAGRVSTDAGAEYIEYAGLWSGDTITGTTRIQRDAANSSWDLDLYASNWGSAVVKMLSAIGAQRIQAYRRLTVESPAASAATVLSLVQLATGATGGAHINFDSKAGTPTGLVAGDLWRDATKLKFYEGTLTHDLNPQTTKGDLTVHNGTAETRLAVGTDTHVLTADSTQATGVKWAAAAGGGDSITVNGVAVVDADFDDVTPAAPASSANVRWQKDGGSPANISANIRFFSPITSADGESIDFDETVTLGNNARVAVRKNSGATVGTRRRLNLIEGSNITLTVTDDALGEEVDVTIAAAAGGSGNFGTAVVDFGAFPGKSDATVDVTGQAAIVAGSKVNAWLRLEATADHSADEHMVESIRVLAGNIVAGTGFTIYARNDSELSEPLEWGHPSHTHTADPTSGLNTAKGIGAPWRGGQGTRLYGLWSLQWQWA